MIIKEIPGHINLFASRSRLFYIYNHQIYQKNYYYVDNILVVFLQGQKFVVTELIQKAWVITNEEIIENLDVKIGKVVFEELKPRHFIDVPLSFYSDNLDYLGLKRVPYLRNIYSTQSGRIYKFYPGRNEFIKLKKHYKDKYKCVHIHESFISNPPSHRVHRLVASAWNPNPNNHKTVDHINMDKNDNRSCNLKWVSEESNLTSAIFNHSLMGNTDYVKMSLLSLLEKNDNFAFT